MERDLADISKVVTLIEKFSPFNLEDTSLRYIINGVCATDETNVLEYQAVGSLIINKMVGEEIFAISFKQAEKNKALENSIRFKAKPKVSVVDPVLLLSKT